ncbi:hypothetical protein REPUB_Repub16aG0074700 [Reevesia pubescens]
MGCVTTATHLGNSKVLGVIPKALAMRNIAGKIVWDEIMVSCMHEHMNIMVKNVDAFISLLGGFETLEQFFQIAS